jgi:hypothetical protein
MEDYAPSWPKSIGGAGEQPIEHWTGSQGRRGVRNRRGTLAEAVRWRRYARRSGDVYGASIYQMTQRLHRDSAFGVALCGDCDVGGQLGQSGGKRRCVRLDPAATAKFHVVKPARLCTGVVSAVTMVGGTRASPGGRVRESS